MPRVYIAKRPFLTTEQWAVLDGLIAARPKSSGTCLALDFAAATGRVISSTTVRNRRRRLKPAARSGAEGA